MRRFPQLLDRKSTRLNSSHTVIYTLSLHDALPIYRLLHDFGIPMIVFAIVALLQLVHVGLFDASLPAIIRSEEHTSELQSHRDLHSFPTRRSSDLSPSA